MDGPRYKQTKNITNIKVKHNKRTKACAAQTHTKTRSVTRWQEWVESPTP
jgi:hypothetical protein